MPVSTNQNNLDWAKASPTQSPGPNPLPLIGGAIDIGFGVYDRMNNAEINRKNFELQKEQQNYERQMHKTIMGREDTAIQRRVADLKKAGLNKALAYGKVGGSASASPMSSNTVPQRAKPDKMQSIFQNMGIMNAMAQIRKTNAETDLIRSNARQSRYTADMSKDTYQQRWYKTAATAMIQKYDLIAKKNNYLQDYYLKAIDLRVKSKTEQILKKNISTEAKIKELQLYLLQKSKQYADSDKFFQYLNSIVGSAKGVYNMTK